MNRDFLKGLELDDDCINKIMAEYGKSINEYKESSEELAAQLEATKETLEEANNKIADFEGLDVESIKAEVENWKTKYEEKEEEAAKQISKIRFESILDKQLLKANARNSKAVKALLNMEDMKLTDEGILGLEEQIKKLKEEEQYLFEDEQGIPNIVSGKRKSGSTLSFADIKEMSVIERSKFKKENPEAYKQALEGK